MTRKQFTSIVHLKNLQLSVCNRLNYLSCIWYLFSKIFVQRFLKQFLTCGFSARKHTRPNFTVWLVPYACVQPYHIIKHHILCLSRDSRSWNCSEKSSFFYLHLSFFSLFKNLTGPKVFELALQLLSTLVILAFIKLRLLIDIPLSLPLGKKREVF